AAPADAPRAWPPPGTDYLTSVTNQTEYDRLARPSNDRSIPFLMRRRGEGDSYPYPWDGYECTFAHDALHLDFLRRMDPTRAVQLYFVDAKSENGTLIPGRIKVDTTKPGNSFHVIIENFSGGFMGPAAYFPLDPVTGQHIRERIKRCVPFATNFTFASFCPTGNRMDCPLP
ncbi:MAG TPA: hypothetical protein VGF45_00890, partial [Polyangia bacterium]